MLHGLIHRFAWVSRRRAIFTLVAVVAVIVAIGLGAQTFLAVRVAHASDASDTVMNKQISRSEIVARAQYWVYTGATYDNPGNGTFGMAEDPLHTPYRKDCSGLVSMAWHLPKVSGSYDYDTLRFNVDKANWWHTIPLDSLAQGDAYVENDSTRHHMELFDHWVNTSDHSQGYFVYSFNKQGQKVQNPLDGTGQRDYAYLKSGFHAIHFEKAGDVLGRGYTLSSLPAGAICSTYGPSTLPASTVSITVRTCFVRAKIIIDGNQTVQVFRAFHEIKWTGGGSGTPSTKKVNRFMAFLDTEYYNTVTAEVFSDTIMDQINNNPTGTHVVGYDVGAPQPGNWTADGWIQFDVTGDGKYSSMIYLNESSISQY